MIKIDVRRPVMFNRKEDWPALMAMGDAVCGKQQFLLLSAVRDHVSVRVAFSQSRQELHYNQSPPHSDPRNVALSRGKRLPALQPTHVETSHTPLFTGSRCRVITNLDRSITVLNAKRRDCFTKTQLVGPPSFCAERVRAQTKDKTANARAYATEFDN